MDLLTGYGSDSGDEQNEHSAPAPSISAKAPPRPSHGHQAAAGPSSVEAGAQELSFSKLPQPKKRIAFQLPINRQMLEAPESDEEAEAERRAKRLKGSNKAKSKLMDYLPPPKNQGDALGAGLGAGAPPGKRAARGGLFGGGDDDDEDDPVLAAGRGDGGAAAVGLTSNEAYRTHEDDGDDGAAAGPGPSSWHDAAGAHAGPQPRAAHHYASAAGSGAPVRASGAPAQAKNQGDLELPDELAGVQFKEINQKDLRYVDPARKETANSLRTALGAEFANELRSQAAGKGGSKLARSKHQIGTLFYNAKMAEIDILEGKAHSMKTKKETQAKYGW